MESEDKADFTNSFEDEDDESEEDDEEDEYVTLTRKSHPPPEKTGTVFLDDEEDDDVVSPLSIVAKKPPMPIPISIAKIVEEKKPLAVDESRKLFQRLWMDEDEIELLQGFLDYTSRRGAGHHDTSMFYDQIRGKLQLDFNKNQLVEKLRRLKKKYRNVLGRIGSGKEYAFKSAHDQTTFEISRKIWTNVGHITPENNLEEDDLGKNCEAEPNTNSVEKKSRKRSRGKSPEKVNPLNSSSIGFPMVEETVKSCLSPLFKELVQAAANGRGFGGVGMSSPLLSPLPLSFVGADMGNEKWRKQQILELEVYSKRLELVQEEIKSMLEELRSAGS